MTSLCLLVVAVVVAASDSNCWPMRMRNFQKFRIAEFDLVPLMSYASTAPLCFVLFSSLCFFVFFFVFLSKYKATSLWGM